MVQGSVNSSFPWTHSGNFPQRVRLHWPSGSQEGTTVSSGTGHLHSKHPETNVFLPHLSHLAAGKATGGCPTTILRGRENPECSQLAGLVVGCGWTCRISGIDRFYLCESALWLLLFFTSVETNLKRSTAEYPLHRSQKVALKSRILVRSEKTLQTHQFPPSPPELMCWAPDAHISLAKGENTVQASWGNAKPGTG